MGLGTIYGSLLLLAVHSAHSSYVALAPSKLYAGWMYKVPVTVNDIPGGSTVTVKGFILDSKNNSVADASVVFSVDGQKILELDVPTSIGSGAYTFRLQGSGAFTFTNTTSITAEYATYITLVQMDKQKYKANQLIRFRVITVDKDLNPVKVPRNITITNPGGSDLRKYIDDGSKAVFEGTYQLTEFPELGEWKIAVKSEEEKIAVESMFQVEEYVLPKFEVAALATPSYIVRGSSQTKVSVGVTAKYTYGKGVLGNVHLKVGKTDLGGVITDPSGLWEREIDLSKELKDYMASININVTVTDETERTYSTMATVKVVNIPVKVEFDMDRSDDVYHTGTGAKVVVKVTNPDGGAVGTKFDNSILSLTLKDYRNESNSLSKTFLVSSEQTVYEWKINQIMSTLSGLNVQAVLTTDEREILRSSHYLNKYETLGRATLKARWLSYPVNMWSTASFAVDLVNKGDFKESSLTYMIVSRGNIQDFGKAMTSSNEVPITPELCPNAQIVVYGVTNTSPPEVIADRLELKLRNCQKKKVTPSTSEKSQRTGTSATINVSVDWTDENDNSPVGEHDVYMLAVDKSVLLLQGVNGDITPDRLDRELSKFSLGSDDSMGDRPMPFARDIMPGPFPIPKQSPKSTGELLENVGLEVLTDMHMKGVYRYIEDERVFAMAAVPRNEIVEDAEAEADKIEPGEGSAAAVTVTVRKDFPDTWIWKSAKTDENGQLSMVEKLPGTITSWVISAFAVRDDSEIALTAVPTELEAFNLFFVDLNLPYSIRRMEMFDLRTTVFNYESYDMNATVTLAESPDFGVKGEMEKTVMVKSNTGKSVTFTIVASTVKTIDLKVTADGKSSDPAKNTKYTDVVIRKLIVKPEGVERIRTEVHTAILSSDQSSYENDTVVDFAPFPMKEIVPQSIRIIIKITGDMMGNMLDNIDDLVQQPTGCGEQNMITTIPNIYAMTYLRAIGESTPDFENKAIGYMIKGYNRETQQYRFPTAGYSAFGTSDKSASTWLTAFVVRSFAQARKFISSTVDEDLLAEDVDFLFKMQENDGSFKEDGRVIHKEMQGGTGGTEALSVYVTMCLLEAKKWGIPVDENRLDKALSYVKKVADGESAKTLFLQALTAYTLALDNADEPKVNIIIGAIKENGAPWKNPKPEKEKPRETLYYHRPARSSDIEVTSYCILVYDLTNKPLDALEAVQWLQKQQNDKGGFRSTQDTVMALQALSEYSAKYVKTVTSSTVTITAFDTDSKIVKTEVVTIDNTNRRLLQMIDVPDTTRKVKVLVEGEKDSLSLIKIAWYFYTLPDEPETRVTIDTTTKREGKNSNRYKLRTCIKKRPEFKYDNMAVVDFALPSGFLVEDFMEAKNNNPAIRRLEDKGDSVFCYIDEIKDMCLEFYLSQEVDVKDLQAGSATLYAYYEPEISAESAVTIDFTSTCFPGQCTSHTAPVASLTGLLWTACICVLLSLLVAV